ncbi:hypothetical protein [Nocardioides sp. HB32]
MPDPIDELEGFTMPHTTPLPPGEVRRRGDRIRRRNNAIAAVGGLAVIAAIATPFAVMANDRTSSEPPVAPSPSPSVTWVHEIPASFPLTEGMPASTKTRDDYEQQAVDVCESEAWNPDGSTTDIRQAIYTGETEGGADRTLALYPSERDADAALQALDANVEGCAAQTTGKNRSAEVVPSEIGDGSIVYADHMSDAGDMFVHQVVRVGNALLVDTTYAMGGGDPQVVQQTADLLEERSTDVVAAMCEFGPGDC